MSKVSIIAWRCWVVIYFICQARIVFWAWLLVLSPRLYDILEEPSKPRARGDELIIKLFGMLDSEVGEVTDLVHFV